MRDIKIYTDALEFAVEAELNRPLAFGCVTKSSNGSHHDMNYRTFKNSIRAITDALKEIKWLEINDFYQLRKVGIIVEDKMFRATAGVNTHKGLIFLHLFLAYAFVNNIKWQDLSIFISKFSKALSKDYINMPKAISWDNHDLDDIRTIPLSGFKDAIELVDRNKSEPLSDNELSLRLIATLDDTTTYHRSNLTTLRYVQGRAKDILKISNQADFIEAAIALDNFYLTNMLSSGGVADMYTTVRTLEQLREEYDA